MADTDPFRSPRIICIDSVQSTVTSATDCEFLHLSRDTLTTDDEGFSTANSQPLPYAYDRNGAASDWLLERKISSSTECPAGGPESPLRSKRTSKNVDLNVDLNVKEELTTSGILEVPRSPVIAPDGGWGWVIVVVSFLCAGVVDGLCSVFGVLLPSLVTYFEQSSSQTAFAGSLLAGGFLLFGPIGSVLINCFGCRVTTIVGAVVSTVSLVTSPFAPNLEVFILLFGGLGGFGISLIYLPASVMVGYYFERRRGIAAGIASSGAGFGMLVLSPLAAYLVNEFSWKGTLIILAGVSLNCVVWGGLMRPLPQPKLTTRSIVKAKLVSSNDELESESNTVTVMVKNRQFAITTMRTRCQSESKTTDGGLHLDMQLVSGSKRSLNCQASGIREESEASPVTGPLQRRDIFYSGSVMSLSRDTGAVDRELSMNSYSREHSSSPCCRAPGSLTTLLEMLDVSLFRNPSFVIICVASVFIQLGYFVPVVFITPYAQTLGISSSAAAMLLSIAGVSNMIGRAGAGALATLPSVNALVLNSVSLVITGLSTALVTVLCTGFTSLIIYSIVFGFSVAVFVPLTTIFLVQYVGLNKLTNAYGLLSMVKGIATMIGPPVAGALYDAQQTYSLTFYFAGLMFALAGVMYYLLKLTSHRCRQSQGSAAV